MATYRVELERDAAKAYRRLPREVRARIDQRLGELAENPRRPGCIKMKGFTDHYRTRVGEYRIRYLIADRILVVTVIEIASRQDSYRLF